MILINFFDHFVKVFFAGTKLFAGFSKLINCYVTAIILVKKSES